MLLFVCVCLQKGVERKINTAPKCANKCPFLALSQFFVTEGTTRYTRGILHAKFALSLWPFPQLVLLGVKQEQDSPWLSELEELFEVLCSGMPPGAGLCLKTQFKPIKNILEWLAF